MISQSDSGQPDRRLNSWKSIAAYFGRDERTVKRWEVQRGLPVHRVPGAGRSSVYAYANELADWLQTADESSSEPLAEDAPPSGAIDDTQALPWTRFFESRTQRRKAL